MRIAKAITAGIGAVISVLTLALADEVLDMSDIGKLITILIEQGIMVFAVLQIPNKDV